MSQPLAAEAVLDLAAAEPDRVALVAGPRRMTYRELADAALALAGRLKATGLQPGERVAIVSENSPEFLVGALATWMAGGIYATVYPSSGATELEYVLRNAEPRLVLAEERREPVTAAAIAATGSAAGLHAIEPGGVRGLPDAEPLAAPDPVEPGDVALICYTSGSTAQPKPVAHSHVGLAGGAHAYTRVWRIGPDDRSLVCQPMAWVYGLGTTSLATLFGGGTVVIQPRYNPVEVVRAIEDERVTVFPGVTTMFVKLVAYAAEAGREVDLRSLRLCISGGEPRNEPAFDRWRELTGCPVHDVYCASECFPVVTYDPLEDPEPRRGCAGKVVPEAEMRVVDEAGNDLPAGEVGEALWRGPALMVGYWNEPELTEAAFADGWYRSRDYTRMDPDGYVYVTGRVSDMIIRGGSNVSPLEVEGVLAAHPDVADVVVVGVPDPEYGEQVAAAIVLAPDGRLDEAALREFCADKLAAYKIPTLFRRFGELPRNANGKVLRREVAPVLRGDAVPAS